MTIRRNRTRYWRGVKSSLCIELVWEDYVGRWGCWTEDGEDAPGVLQIVLERVLPRLCGGALELEIVYTFDATAYRGTTPPGGPDPDEFVWENHKLVRVELDDVSDPRQPSPLPLDAFQQASIWLAYSERVAQLIPEVPDDE